MTITDPNLPAPTNEADCIELLKIGGLECIKPAVNFLEALPEYANNPYKAYMLKVAHSLLNIAGYILENVTGQPDGAYGAGGGGKPGW
jgi:hypothetical protein